MKTTIAAIIAAIIALFLVTACTTTTPSVITKTETRVVRIPATLTDCRTLRRLPDPETLTDKQVAQTLLKLHTRLKECAADDVSVRKLLVEYEKLYEDTEGSK